jgi:hypothetical protein
MRTHWLVLKLVVLFCVSSAFCQTSDSQAQRSGPDIDSQIETLRADFRADKTQVVSEAMGLSEKESKLFWPIYRKYEEELTAVNDQRVALIKQYAEKFTSMNDHEARAMLDQALNFEEKRGDLKKKYAKEFDKAGLSGMTTTKFFQLEHRLDALVDLQLASELPSLLSRKEAK